MNNQILPVSVTGKAMEAIRSIRAAKQIPDFYGLRIGVRGGGGCGGFSYLLGFDLKKDGDAEYEFEGMKLLIEKKQMLYVAGKVIDYIDDGVELGFSFQDEKKP